MLRRLWHFLAGHEWVERDCVFNPPMGTCLKVPATPEALWYERGFTDITLTCPCGELKVHRLIGQHAPAGDSEVAQLRKMAGLPSGGGSNA